jgi:type VI protein secretion system component VasF
MIPAMSQKEEILRNAQKMAEEDAKRKASIIGDRPSRGIRSRMPLGCFLWIALAIVLAIWFLKKHIFGI